MRARQAGRPCGRPDDSIFGQCRAIHGHAAARGSRGVALVGFRAPLGVRPAGRVYGSVAVPVTMDLIEVERGGALWPRHAPLGLRAPRRTARVWYVRCPRAPRNALVPPVIVNVPRLSLVAVHFFEL